jgi:uncharacterized membrane protein
MPVDTYGAICIIILAFIIGYVIGTKYSNIDYAKMYAETKQKLDDKVRELKRYRTK